MHDKQFRPSSPAETEVMLQTSVEEFRPPSPANSEFQFHIVEESVHDTNDEEMEIEEDMVPFRSVSPAQTEIVLSDSVCTRPYTETIAGSVGPIIPFNPMVLISAYDIFDMISSLEVYYSKDSGQFLHFIMDCSLARSNTTSFM